jgi:hypothetical protein
MLAERSAPHGSDANLAVTGFIVGDGGGEKLVHYGGKNRATGVVAI